MLPGILEAVWGKVPRGGPLLVKAGTLDHPGGPPRQRELIYASTSENIGSHFKS